MLIELSLRDLPGVGDVKVSAANSQTVVTFDESVITADLIIKEMGNAGYGAERAA
jgi:copper chaperone CopZ